MDGAVCFFDIFSCFIIPSQMIVFAIGQRTNGCLACGVSHSSSTGISPPSIPLGPTHCLRRSERSDYGCKGVPDPLCVVAHALPNAFYSGVVIARSIYRKSWRTCRPARHRRDVSVCLILRRNYPPGFLFQSAGASMPDRWGKEREGNLPRRS